MSVDRRLIRRSLVATFVVYTVFGLPDGMFGAIWPNLRDDFGRTDSGLGFLILTMAIGYAAGSVSSGHLATRLGIDRLLPFAMSSAAAALVVVAAAPSWWIVGAGYAALGVGWGIADAGINAWMTITQGARQMGLLHAFYGVGAFLGPLLATLFVADDRSWRAPYVVCVVLTIAAVALLLRSRPGFAAALPTAEVAASVGAAPGSNRLLVLMVAWFSFYVGVEVTIGSWAFTLLTEGRGESEVVAGILTASFWGGLMVGRLVLGAIGHRIQPERAVWGSTGFALAGAIVLWIDPVGVGAWGALPVLGLSLSMLFPLVMGRTAVYLGEARATRAVGYQIGASAIGFTLLPALVGFLADEYGIETAAPVIVGIVAVVGGLWFAIERTTASARAGVSVDRRGERTGR